MTDVYSSIKRTLGVGSALLALGISACATEYSAKSIAAKVVDAASGQPLEGVNVVAHWMLEEPQGAQWEGDLELMEAVTDQLGQFDLPAWGPKAVPSGKAPGTRLTNQDPAILFFKRGYWPRAVINDSHPAMLRDPESKGANVRDSEWNGKTITLKKFDGTMAAYSGAVSALLGTVSYGNCGWKKIPRMMLALNNEAVRLDRDHVFNDIPTIRHLENISAGEDCGPVREFLEGHSR